MSTSEYLSVLVSIVVGLGLTQLLASVGRLLVQRRRVRSYWLSAFQAVLVFVAHVQFWWSNFDYGSRLEGNFFAFLYFLLAPIALFLMSMLALPETDAAGEISMRTHYWRNHTIFFALAAAVPLLNATRNIVFQGDPLLTADRPFELVFCLLAASGAVVRSERWHRVLAVLVLALFATMVVLTSLAPG